MAIVRPEEAREEADAALSAAVGAKDLEGLKAAIEAAEAAGVAKKSLQRARKAAEKLQEEEEKEEEAPANKADDEDALADAIVAAAMLESWPGADETAEADRHAESQEDSGSGQGEPRGSDEDAAFLVPAASAEASGCESDGEAYLAVCSLCCATHLLDLDVMGLGIDFDCCMVGAACEGSETAAAGPSRARTAAPAGGGDAKTRVLTAEERQAIFAKYGRGIEASGNKAAAPLVPVREMPKIRFRDDKIVTHKGERIIKEARSSKKERAHVKTNVAAGGRESSVFETKTSMS